jgi:hypothetical protein
MKLNNKNSREVKSRGKVLDKCFEKPNIKFIHDLKKNVGPSKYKNNNKNIESNGNRSKKKLKNKNSEIKNIDPGKPKKTNVFKRIIRNSFGHIKFKPLISVIKRVLNLLATASTSKNELVDNKAWLINMQKLANIKFDCPLITQIVSQCISTTVE